MSRNDFEWIYTQHPHVARRKMILGECAWTGYAGGLVPRWRPASRAPPNPERAELANVQVALNSRARLHRYQFFGWGHL